MNKARREALEKLHKELSALVSPELLAAIALIQSKKESLVDLKNTLETERDEEQENFDNMPESLQQTERGQNMEQAISEMEDAINALGEVESAFDELDEHATTIQEKIDEANGSIDNATSY